jgi:hypothetical protein
LQNLKRNSHEPLHSCVGGDGEVATLMEQDEYPNPGQQFGLSNELYECYQEEQRREYAFYILSNNKTDLN